MSHNDLHGSCVQWRIHRGCMVLKADDVELDYQLHTQIPTLTRALGGQDC